MLTRTMRHPLSYLAFGMLLIPCLLSKAEEASQDKFEHYTPESRAYAHECYEHFIELSNHLENGEFFEEAIFQVYETKGFPPERTIKTRLNKSKKEDLEELRKLQKTIRLRLPFPVQGFGTVPQICGLKITYAKREFWIYATKGAFTTNSTLGGTSIMTIYESPALAAIFQKYYKEATGQDLDPKIISAWSGKYQFEEKTEK